jgi:hypothetical protein
MKKFILKGYYSNITHRITLFLNCVHHLVFLGGGGIWNWITPPSLGEWWAGGYIIQFVVNTKRATLNLCTHLIRHIFHLRMGLFNFWHAVFFSEYYMMAKIQKPSNSSNRKLTTCSMKLEHLLQSTKRHFIIIIRHCYQWRCKWQTTNAEWVWNWGGISTVA